VGHSVGLVLNATREWFTLSVPRQNNLGVPVSGLGTLEYNRVGLTIGNTFKVQFFRFGRCGQSMYV
jgi:hypothetical protein